MKRKSSKKIDVQYLLRSRNVLYIVLVLAVLNLFSYLMLKQLDAVAFFIIIGFLTTYFSKNMIIVMLTAMLSTFIIVKIQLLGRREGFKEGASKTEETDEKKDDEKKDGEKKDTKKKDGEKKDTKKKDTKKKDTKKKEDDKKDGETKDGETKDGDNFTQQLSPARYNVNDDDDTPRRHKPNVDYSATLESAYDNLDKLLSSDAIRNMSADTGRLAEKQQKLMGNIQKLTPIMDKASSVLNGLDIGGISGLMNGIQDRLKGFGKPVVDKKEGKKNVK